MRTDGSVEKAKLIYTSRISSYVICYVTQILCLVYELLQTIQGGQVVIQTHCSFINLENSQ
jgi:hypothetical protein